MSTQNLKVSDLVKHFADGGDIGAYHTGLGSVVESRVAALVAANKAEQLREHFNLQEATVEAEAEEGAAEEGQAQEAAEEQSAADAEETTEGEQEGQEQSEGEGEAAEGEGEDQSASEAEAGAEAADEEGAADQEAEEPSHITESFRAFARKRK